MTPQSALTRIPLDKQEKNSSTDTLPSPSDLQRLILTVFKSGRIRKLISFYAGGREDAYQECFSRLWERRDSYYNTPEKNELHWAYAHCHQALRTGLSMYRGGSKIQYCDLGYRKTDAGHRIGQRHETKHLTDVDATSLYARGDHEKQVEAKELCDKIVSIFPPTTRSGQILRLMTSGYGVRDIRRKLGMHRGTVSTHIQRIRLRLRVQHPEISWP